jgi:hypothetical protein
MDNRDNNPTPPQVPLAPEFYSFATGKPFERCVACNTYLLAPGTQYLIEKAIIRYPNTQVSDVAFEYAMCLPCAEKMRQSLSADSLTALENHFSRHADFASRQKIMDDPTNTNPQDWIAHCLLTQTPLAEQSEYQLIAHCDGTNLVVGMAPYMISGKAADELSELLSAKTKEILDDFVDDHFGFPPELKALIKEKNLLLI